MIRNTRFSLFALMATASGCSSADPCEGQSGACLTLIIKGADAAVDSLDANLAGAVNHHFSATPPGGKIALPFVKGVLLPDTPGRVAAGATAAVNGHTLSGRAEFDLTPNLHMTLVIELAGSCGGMGCVAWQAVNNGLYGGEVKAVTVDPNDVNELVVFAGTERGGAFRSIDGGKSWKPLSIGPTVVTVNAIAVTPQDSKIVYAGTYGGIFQSLDGGDTWMKMKTTNVNALLVDPTTTTTIYAGTQTTGILKKTDKNPWATTTSLGLPVFPIRSLAMSATALYAGTDAGLFSTSDGAASWSACVGWPSGTAAPFVAMAPSKPGRGYAATATGAIYRTDDGKSWSATAGKTAKGYPSGLVVDPKQPEVAYVAFAATAGAYVFRTADGGNTWRLVTTGLSNSGTQSLAIGSSSSSIVYAGTQGGGIFKTDNAGDLWRPANFGLTALTILALACDPSGIVYAGTSGGGVFKTVDNGGQWTAMSTGLDNLHIGSIEIDPFDAKIVYAGTLGDGVYRSNDGAKTWTSTDSMGLESIISLAGDPQATGVVYAGAGASGKVYRTTDRGESWHASVTDAYVRELAIDIRHAGTIYAATDSSLSHLSSWGQQWTTVLMNIKFYAVVVDPTSSAVYAAGNNVYKDGMKVLNHSSVFAMAMDPMNPSVLYVGGNAADGTYRTIDAGTSWSTAGVGLPAFSDHGGFVSAFAVDRRTKGRVYAGTYGAGVYRSDTGGR